MPAEGRKRAALYVRVSTASQVETGTSLATQERDARAFAERHGWEVVALVADRGVSGRRADRAGIRTLMQLARERKIDVVVPTTSDRFGRSLLDSLTIQRDLGELGVAVLSADGHLDTLSDGGRLTTSIFAAIAEEESRTIARRTSLGRLRATEEGRFTGSTAPWGWRAVPAPEGENGKRLVPDQQAQAGIRRAVKLLSEGVSYGDAARALTSEGHMTKGNGAFAPGPWTAATLRRWVRTRGEKTADAVWRLGGIEVAIPPILPPDEAAQLRRLARSTAPKTQQAHGPYLLAGRLVAPCGGMMHGRTVTNRRDGRVQPPVYACTRRMRKRQNEARCDCHNVPVEWVDEAVWAHIAAIITDDQTLRALAREHAGSERAEDQATALDELEAEVEKLRAEVVETHTAARAQGMDVMTALALVKPVQAQLDATLVELERAERVQQTREGRDRGHLRDIVRDLRREISVGEHERRRLILDALDVRAFVSTEPCETCGGTGYHGGFDPETQQPRICPTCKRFRIALNVRVQIQDVGLVVALVRSVSA